MGEIAESIIDGECCDVCGQFFHEPYGYPVTCTECGGEGELIDFNRIEFEDEN